MGSGGRVDYTAESIASRYAAGRFLEPRQLSAWQTAVAPYLPSPRAAGVVLDVGSGVGVFSSALRTWATRLVVALEPSGAMRAKAGRETGLALAAGRAERLPLRDASVRVAWLSAVLHHLDDRGAAVGELGRVVADDGTVLIRGLFAGVSTVRWLEAFPGHERVYQQFPTLSDTRAAFKDGGFDLVAVHDVTERQVTNGEAATWATEMRSVDSMLVPFTDDEFAAGLHALQTAPAEDATGHINLVVFRKE